MPKSTKYLFDSDVLIASKNLHYRPTFCQAFWDWIEHGHRKGIFFSLDAVKKELISGNEDDLLHEWALRPSLEGFFMSSRATAPQWSNLSSWVQNRRPAYITDAINKFLDQRFADGWLVSYVLQHSEYVIVTAETSEPASKRSVKLPDAAAAFSIETTDLFSVLRTHAINNFLLTGI
jgi:hypothetical protein